MASLEFPSGPARKAEESPLEAERRAIRVKMLAAGLDVIETNKDTFPKEISREGFDGLSKRGELCLVALVGAARKFWSGLLIKDHFEKDENARYALQNSMKGNVVYSDEFDGKNKLRTNVQDNLYKGFKIFVEELDKSNIRTPQADKVRELYSSLFPVEHVGYRNDHNSKVARDFIEKFPSMPPIDTDFDSDSARPTYREYYLNLSEEQRLAIISNFDKAAHDFLELVTRPAADGPGTEVN